METFCSSPFAREYGSKTMSIFFFYSLIYNLVISDSQKCRSCQKKQHFGPLKYDFPLGRGPTYIVIGPWIGGLYHVNRFKFETIKIYLSCTRLTLNIKFIGFWLFSKYLKLGLSTKNKLHNSFFYKILIWFIIIHNLFDLWLHSAS